MDSFGMIPKHFKSFKLFKVKKDEYVIKKLIKLSITFLLLTITIIPTIDHVEMCCKKHGKT